MGSTAAACCLYRLYSLWPDTEVDAPEIDRVNASGQSPNSMTARWSLCARAGASTVSGPAWTRQQQQASSPGASPVAPQPSLSCCPPTPSLRQQEWEAHNMQQGGWIDAAANTEVTRGGPPPLSTHSSMPVMQQLELVLQRGIAKRVSPQGVSRICPLTTTSAS